MPGMPPNVRLCATLPAIPTRRGHHASGVAGKVVPQLKQTRAPELAEFLEHRAIHRDDGVLHRLALIPAAPPRVP
jgi:hypothetical protein